ncbi:MAG: NAD-dependent epimerase/dehydratase family protein [Polyangiaceae bacterium]|nr:NAD-dependent epimerase/dehydratase family protein [Polyangiaceae bacterium]
MTNSTDIAAVSGATGFIGSAVVRELLAQGRVVRALCEPGAKTTNLEGLPEDRVEQISVDVNDREGMLRALDGAATFFHLAAIYKVWTLDPAAIWHVNLEGTTTSLLAARDAGVKRVVYTSSIAAVGLGEGQTPADETTPWNIADIANDYIASKYQAERVAIRLAEAGLPLVCVNPAFPFGRGDIGPTPTGGIILNLLRGQVPAVGKGGFCAIDVDDVAKAHVAAESRGRIGERYILGNHNVSLREFFELVSDVAGLPAPRMSMPAVFARGAARGMEFVSDHFTKKAPLATYKSVQYMQRYAYFDGSKARRELEMPCTPLRTSVERAVEYFRTSGMV